MPTLAASSAYPLASVAPPAHRHTTRVTTITVTTVGAPSRARLLAALRIILAAQRSDVAAANPEVAQ